MVNNSRAHEKLWDEMRHRAHAQGAPDHLVNAIAQVMTGKEIEGRNSQRHSRSIYAVQSDIRWNHFRRGRIVKSWRKIKRTDSGGRLKPDERWRTGITRVILQWLLQKWLLRCDMAKSPEAEYDHGVLLERCRTWWSLRREKRLLQMDIHLTREQQGPQAAQSTDYLR